MGHSAGAHRRDTADMPRPVRKPVPTASEQRGERWRKHSAHSGTEMAEGVGFEPTVTFQPRRFSRPVPSTARPPLRFATADARDGFLQPMRQARVPLGTMTKTVAA